MRIRTIALLLTLLGGAAPRLWGQGPPAPADPMDMSLADLMKVDIDSVYGASGYKQQVADTPASITVITADEIRRYGYRSLADVLRKVPGFYLTHDRVYNYIGERGFGPPGDYNTRFLLLVDGHRMNADVDGNIGIAMDFPVDIDLIDRVEVIRGPNSSTYIASALLGVINVVTKRGADVAGLAVSSEMASYGTYKSRVTYGHQFRNGLDVLLSGTYYDSHGPDSLFFREFNSPSTNNGIARNADGGRADQVFGKLTYHDFTLEGAYDFSVQGDPTASYGAIFNDSEERIGLAPSFLDLSYDHHFGSDWGYRAQLYYGNNRYHGVYPTDESELGGDAHVLNEDYSHGQDVGVTMAFSKQLPGRHKVIAGFEYRDVFQQDQWNYDAEPYHRYLDSKESSSLGSIHAQDEIPLRRDLVLDLGLSYDYYSTFRGTTNPRAALIYQPFERTTLKLLYGQSFRAPTAFETYYAFSAPWGMQEANPNLRPETAKSTELVWEQSLQKNFHLVVSGYYYPVRRVIQAETDPANGAVVYENTEGVDLTGLEIALKRQLRSGLEAGISYTLEDARDKVVDAQSSVVDSPHTLGLANLSVPLFKKKLFASMDVQYVSRRRTLAGNFAGAYVVPNFTIYSPNALRNWEISASLYNAFDNVYGDPASVAHTEDIIFQNGRNFRLKAAYHF
jgi:outer membrane receptor for ferrienterochelin and colicins